MAMMHRTYPYPETTTREKLGGIPLTVVCTVTVETKGAMEAERQPDQPRRRYALRQERYYQFIFGSPGDPAYRIADPHPPMHTVGKNVRPFLVRWTVNQRSYEPFEFDPQRHIQPWLFGYNHSRRLDAKSGNLVDTTASQDLVIREFIARQMEENAGEYRALADQWCERNDYAQALDVKAQLVEKLAAAADEVARIEAKHAPEWLADVVEMTRTEAGAGR